MSSLFTKAEMDILDNPHSGLGNYNSIIFDVNQNPNRYFQTLSRWGANPKYVNDTRASRYFVFYCHPDFKSYYDNMINEHARIIDVTTENIQGTCYGVVMLEQPRKFYTVFSPIASTKYIVMGEAAYIVCQAHLDNLHNDPEWIAYNVADAERTARLARKNDLYVMKEIN